MAQGLFFRFVFIFNFLKINYFSFLDMLGLVIHHFWWKEYFSRTTGSHRYTNSIELVPRFVGCDHPLSAAAERPDFWKKYSKKNVFWRTFRMDSGWMRVTRGGSGAEAPPLAARPGPPWKIFIPKLSGQIQPSGPLREASPLGYAMRGQRIYLVDPKSLPWDRVGSQASIHRSPNNYNQAHVGFYWTWPFTTRLGFHMTVGWHMDCLLPPVTIISAKTW